MSALSAIRPLDVIVGGVEPDAATVAVSGDLDGDTVSRVVEVLTGQLALGHRFVRLNLGGVRFLDRAALGSLVQAHNRFLDARGTLILSGLGRSAAQLMRLTGNDQVLLVADGSSRPRLDWGRADTIAVGAP